jgi:hypothetical protein
LRCDTSAVIDRAQVAAGHRLPPLRWATGLPRPEPCSSVGPVRRASKPRRGPVSAQSADGYMHSRSRSHRRKVLGRDGLGGPGAGLTGPLVSDLRLGGPILRASNRTPRVALIPVKAARDRAPTTPPPGRPSSEMSGSSWRTYWEPVPDQCLVSRARSVMTERNGLERRLRPISTGPSRARGVMQSATFPSAPDFATARCVQAQIGVRLRSIYDVVLAEPVPDEWPDPLRKRENGDGGLVSLGLRQR